MNTKHSKHDFSQIFGKDIDSLLSNISEEYGRVVRQQLIEILDRYSEYYINTEKEIYIGMAIYIWYVENYFGKKESKGKSKSELLDLAVDFCLYRYKMLWFIPKFTRRECRTYIQHLYLKSHPVLQSE